MDIKKKKKKKIQNFEKTQAQWGPPARLKGWYLNRGMAYSFDPYDLIARRVIYNHAGIVGIMAC